MAADPAETLATTMATLLTAASSGMVYSFTATAPAKPSLNREDSALKVQCVPVDTDHTKITRGSNATINDYGVRVLITSGLTATVNRPSMSQLRHEIVQEIKDMTIAGFSRAGVETEVQFDMDHLNNHNQFTAVVKATFADIQE